MQKSLPPILAAATALLTYLISANAVFSLLAAFVVFRLMSATNSFSADGDAMGRQREPAGTSQRIEENEQRGRESSASEQVTQAPDSPPMLTDIFKNIRNQIGEDSPAMDARENAREAERPRSSNSESNRQAETIRRRVAENLSRKKPAHRGRDDMHGTPAYMDQLAELDRRISLGEISDVEYDKIYDSIVRHAQP